jgi:hypothetical protein
MQIPENDLVGKVAQLEESVLEIESRLDKSIVDTNNNFRAQYKAWKLYKYFLYFLVIVVLILSEPRQSLFRVLKPTIDTIYKTFLLK